MLQLIKRYYSGRTTTKMSGKHWLSLENINQGSVAFWEENRATPRKARTTSEIDCLEASSNSKKGKRKMSTTGTAESGGIESL